MYLLGKKTDNSQSIYNFLYKFFGLKDLLIIHILSKLGVSKNYKVGDLNKQQIKFIDFILKNCILTDIDLRKRLHTNIKKLKDLYCYRGHRHQSGLPARGQRTHGNMRTVMRLNKKR